MMTVRGSCTLLSAQKSRVPRRRNLETTDAFVFVRKHDIMSAVSWDT